MDDKRNGEIAFGVLYKRLFVAGRCSHHLSVNKAVFKRNAAPEGQRDGSVAFQLNRDKDSPLMIKLVQL